MLDQRCWARKPAGSQDISINTEISAFLFIRLDHLRNVQVTPGLKTIARKQMGTEAVPFQALATIQSDRNLQSSQG